MIFLFWLHSLCHAQEDVSEERAKELFFNGQMLYEEGEYGSAVLAWERGYELTKLPAFLKNIALAHESDNNFADAIVYLRKYRAFAPFEEQEELKSWMTELEVKLQQQLDQQASETAATESDTSQTPAISDIPDEEVLVPKTIDEEVQSHSLPKNSKSLTVLSAASTSTFIAAASLSTLYTHSLFSDINTHCKLTDGVGYCSSEVQENDLLSQFKRSQTTSIFLWSAAVAGVGLTTWQATKPVHVHISQGGFTIGGQF